jgi:hypothetical protein
MLAPLASTGMLMSMVFEARAFVAQPSPGTRPQVSLVRNTVGSESSSSSGEASAATYAAFAVGAGAALALVQRLDRRASLAARHYKRIPKAWWNVEETEDPTSLPLWQRDARYGYQVLKREMVRARKEGKKIFWDVRVLRQLEDRHGESFGCEVEMLNSGLIGFVPRGDEGKWYPKKGRERMKVGEVYKVECTACPQKRVTSREPKESPWCQIEVDPRLEKQMPYFSHFMYLEQQHSIEKAQELEAGTVIKAWVHKHCAKGLVMLLEGEHLPKGMLAMQDISRKKAAHKYVERMFPLGTEMKCYIVHADKENGRITLSCKEFEDDERVGWMLSFPERCFKDCEEAVEIYHKRRDTYIEFLQRGGKHMRQMETA